MQKKKNVVLIVNSITRELYRKDNGKPVMSDMSVSMRAPLDKGGTRLDVGADGVIVEPAVTPELKEKIYLKYPYNNNRPEYVCGEGWDNEYTLIPVKIDLVNDLNGTKKAQITSFHSGDYINEVEEVCSIGIGRDDNDYGLRKLKPNENYYGNEIKPNAEKTCHVADEKTVTLPGRRDTVNPSPLLWANYTDLFFGG